MWLVERVDFLESIYHDDDDDGNAFLMIPGQGERNAELQLICIGCRCNPKVS